MALRHYEIANLVHHYLVKEGYDSVAEFFVTICSHLSGLKSLNNSHQGTKKLPRLFGPSLIDLYEEYLDCKDQLVDELEQLDCVDFRPQDSLPTLLKTLVHQLKQKSKNASTPVPKQTNDASVNTEAEIVSDTSSTQSTPSVSETIPSNDEDVLEPLDLLGAVCDRMLEDTELQAKLAESINKNILNHLDQSKISSDPLLSSTSSHKLDPMLVKAVVEETQADPLFDSIVQDFLGKEEESFPPDSLFAHCENEEVTSNATSVVPYPHTSGTDTFCQQVSPSKSHAGHSSSTESQVIISPKKANVTVTSYAVVTCANGNVTYIPSVLSAIPPFAITPTPTVPKPRRQPVAIAPKPPTPVNQQCAQVPEKSTTETKTCLPASNLSELSAKVDSAVKEAIADFDQEISLIPCDPNQPPIKVRISAGRHVEFAPSPPSVLQQPISVHSSPVKEKLPNLPAEAVPEVKKESKKSTKQRKSHTKLQEAVPEKRQSTANAHVVLLSHLSKLASEKLAREEAEKNADRTVVETTPVPATTESSANEVPNCTPALQTVPQPVLSTPSSAGRNRSHVRALFTSSPDPDNDSHIGTLPASASTPAPWDSFLRSKVSTSGPSDSQIFSTPKGKAKKARKSSPQNGAKTKANDEAANVSQSAPPAETAADAPVETSVNETSNEIDCAANTSAVEMTVIESQNNADTSLTTVTVTVDPESVTAQLLSEIVNSPTKESNAAFQLSSSAGHPVANPAGTSAEPPISQPLMNSLFTPQKPLERTVLTYEGTMSSAFGWDGEVPRTPQIKMEGNSSSSPFLVSLTKGFQFLPAAESPSLAGTPLTPSILNYGQSCSVETPFASLNRMLGILSTPRLEALRNEVMESPGKDASNTMISPTQFVLGRSTPYFVPSGERSRGPFQQIATPEHQTEERTRRIPSEIVGPLRLEDAIDASSFQDGSNKSTSAQLTSTAPANQVVKGKESDKRKTTADGKLDNILINECERPDQSQKNVAAATSTLVAVDSQKPKLREKLVELFGEDSTLSLITAPSPAKFASSNQVEPPQEETAFQKNTNGEPENPGTLTARQPTDKALSAWWERGKPAAAGTTSGEPEKTNVEETADSPLLDAGTQKRSNSKPAAAGTTSEEPEETNVEETADSPLLGARKQKRSKPLLEEEDWMDSDGGDKEAVIQELMSMATKSAKIDRNLLASSKTSKQTEPSSSKRKSRTNNKATSTGDAENPTRKKRTSLPNNTTEAAEVSVEEKQRSRSYSKTRRPSVSAETQPESPQPVQQPVEGPQKRKSRSTSRSSAAPSETDPSVTETEPKKRRSRRLSTAEDLSENNKETNLTGTEKSDAPGNEVTSTSEAGSKKMRSRRKSVTKTDEASADPEPVETDARLPEIAKVKRKSRVSIPGTSATSNEPLAALPRNKRHSASPKLIALSPSKEKVPENRKKVPEKSVRKLSFDLVTHSRKRRISLSKKSSPDRVTSSKLRGSPTKVAWRQFRSPPKLFKAIPPPYERKAVSFRQSAGGSAKKFSVEANSCVENNNNNNPSKEVSEVENQVRANENDTNDVENQMAELHGELDQQSSLNTSDKENPDNTISNKERSTPAEDAAQEKPDLGIEDESLNFDAILSDIAATDDVETVSISLPRTLSAKSYVNDVVVRPEESSPPHTSLADDAGKSIPVEVLEKSTEAVEASRKSSNGPGTKSCDDVQLEKLPIRKSPRKRANAEVCSDPVDAEDGKKKPTSQIGQSKSNRSSGKLGNYLELMSFVDNQKKQPTHRADQVPAAAATSETRQTDSTSNFEAKIVMTGLVQRLQKRLVVNNSDLYSQ